MRSEEKTVLLPDGSREEENKKEDQDTPAAICGRGVLMDQSSAFSSQRIISPWTREG